MHKRKKVGRTGGGRKKAGEQGQQFLPHYLTAHIHHCENLRSDTEQS
jgi:hypothetical protein